MKKWIKNKKNQTSILLVGAQILLIVYLIVPVHNKLSYYKEKTESSLRESRRLEKYSFYLDHHLEKLTGVRERLETLKNQTPRNIDDASLQSQLGKLRRKLNLTVISQKIESRESQKLYDKIIVRQTLKGKYNDQMQYIKSLYSLNTLMLLSKCVYESVDTLMSTDPDLLVGLESIYLIPKY